MPQSIKLLDAANAVADGTAVKIGSAQNLDFAVILSDLLETGETCTVELQYPAAGDAWVPFKKIDLTDASPLVTRHNESNARGFDTIRASLTAEAFNAETVTVTMNWRTPGPVAVERF
jgi:hypothetical protein